MAEDRDEREIALAHVLDKLADALKANPQGRGPWQLRISDIIAILSLCGMIYAFVTNQTATQTTYVNRLENNEQTLREVKRNSDSIPMLDYQMKQLSAKQESMDKDRQSDRTQIQEMHETLLKLGLNLKTK